MKKVKQIAVPKEDLERLLASAGQAVLVGGQALAFWANHYGVDVSDSPEAIVTKDVDFLGERQDVERLAAAVGGSVEFPKKEMSILVGVVRKRVTPEEEYEVDVLWRINGATEAEIRREAVRRPLADGSRFSVMSPIECLITRIANLHKIQDKQTPAGIWQARKSIEIARRHIEDMLSKDAERLAVRAATRILAGATHAMGMNAYKKYGIDILDAVPVKRYTLRSFLQQQWPRSIVRIEKVRGIQSQDEVRVRAT